MRAGCDPVAPWPRIARVGTNAKSLLPAVVVMKLEVLLSAAAAAAAAAATAATTTVRTEEERQKEAFNFRRLFIGFMALLRLMNCTSARLPPGF